MHILSILSWLTPLALAGALPRSSSLTSPTCKAFPGTPSWPSIDTWTRLNETLHGQLLRPDLPGGVCHPEQPNFDEEKCKDVGAGGEVGKGLWSSHDWHTADPLSSQWDNWSNWTCLPRPEAPCSRDGYPAYVVNASTAEHVAAAVNFARENNVRLSVKSTGHDFLGRSVAPGSLSIWVHHLNSLAFHEGSFTLSNGGRNGLVIPGDALTVGGGAEMYDIYRYADQYKATIVGGGAKTVSVGGYVTGGGHGLLSPTYGLAADNVLQMEVVTPAGELLVVNEMQNQDLFWALRGGGGSTFGVLTSVTFKAYPTPKIQFNKFFLGIPSNAAQTKAFLAWVLGQIPSIMDAGFVGYDFFGLDQIAPAPEFGITTRLAGLEGSLTLINREEGALRAEMAKINETMKNEFGEGVAYFFSRGVTYYDSFFEWFEIHFDPRFVGISSTLKSRLINESALTENPEAIVDAMLSAAEPNANVGLFLVGGEAVNNAVPRGGSNAVNPAWRKALVHSVAASTLMPFNRAFEKEAVARLDAAYEPLIELTPGMGAYINEASAFEKNAPLTFWGDNYDRLLSIKRAVDPEDVFWCSPCVGNQRWEQKEGGQLCRVDSARGR